MYNTSMATPEPEKERLAAHLKALVGERFPFSSYHRLLEAQHYIQTQLQSHGFLVEEDVFRFLGRSYSNLIVRIAAAKKAPRLILGAHFDTVWGTPGADDNASGVAVLLEAARVLAGTQPEIPIELVAFNLEEFSMVGSSAYVKRLKREKTRIAGMISLEMVGYTDRRKGSQQIPLGLKHLYPDTGDFIGLISNRRSKTFLHQVACNMKTVPDLSVQTLAVALNGWVLPPTRLSDHSPFWDAGYPALMVTDTSFFRNPHYHGPNDTFETLDLDFMFKVCKGIVATLKKLARMD